MRPPTAILIKREFGGVSINLQAFSQVLGSGDGLSYVAPNQIERFIFDDGTSLDFTQIVERVLTDARTTGDDAIYGLLNDNTLDGGAGNDYLSGGAGADTYVFGRGYGRDVIEDNDASSKLFGDTPDTLSFKDDLRWTDFDYLRDGASDTLTMRITGTTDQVTMVDFLKNVFGFVVYNRIETIAFADGTHWTWQQFARPFHPGRGDRWQRPHLRVRGHRLDLRRRHRQRPDRGRHRRQPLSVPARVWHRHDPRHGRHRRAGAAGLSTTAT